MFTYEQFFSAIRWGMTTLGVTLANMGFMNNGIWEGITGLVVAAAPFVWSMIRHTKLGTILAAEKDVDVAGVIMKQTSQGRAIAAPNASPMTVAVQGTTAAVAVAAGGDPKVARPL